MESGKVFGVLSQGVGDPTTGHSLPGIVKAEPVYPILDAVKRLKSTDVAELERVIEDFRKPSS